LKTLLFKKITSPKVKKKHTKTGDQRKRSKVRRQKRRSSKAGGTTKSKRGINLRGKASKPASKRKIYNGREKEY